MADMVLLDTMICIWAFKGEASPGQEDKPRQARALVSRLEDEGFEIGISSVTLAEFLVPLKAAQRISFCRSIQNAVCVCAFDAGAALESARLVSFWLGTQGRVAGDRQIVKADSQIAGTAVFHKASALYSEDAQLQRIAGRDIKVKPLPPIDQPELDL
jgi:predicted nucleic acid-binding protein